MIKRLDLSLTKQQVQDVRQQIEGHIFALKNWIATQVEAKNFDKAQELVAELRRHEDLLRTFSLKPFEE